MLEDTSFQVASHTGVKDAGIICHDVYVESSRVDPKLYFIFNYSKWDVYGMVMDLNLLVGYSYKW